VDLAVGCDVLVLYIHAPMCSGTDVVGWTPKSSRGLGATTLIGNKKCEFGIEIAQTSKQEALISPSSLNVRPPI